MLQTAINFLHHLRAGDGQAWRPLLAVHYLTYACAFRWPYCSDGTGTPYHALHEPALGAAENLEILRRIQCHRRSPIMRPGPGSPSEIP
jgi:hypothetical protein